MNKIPSLFLTVAISLSFLGTIYGETDTSASLGGKALLEQDQKQIESLEVKLAEFKKSGGDASVIQAYIDLAKEMMELNNERHALHEATKSFEKAVGIFSKKIEVIIQKVNEILTTQSEAVIKNAQAIELLQPKPAAATQNVGNGKATESKSANDGDETDKEDDE